MTKLSESILRQINEQHRKPLPRWIFLLKNIAIWMVVVLSVLAAGIFLGTIVSNFILADWQLAPRWPGQRIGFMKDLITGIWIFGIVIAVTGALLFFRSTKRGYKYGALVISAIILASTAVTALSLLPTSVPNYMRGWKEEHMPPMINADRFHNPEEGRLYGEITGGEEDTMYLTTSDGTEWELWLFDTPRINEGDFVMVFGEVIDQQIFAVMDMRLVPENFMQE